jgi:hydrogenase/urease accessory protein HupE
MKLLHLTFIMVSSFVIGIADAHESRPAYLKLSLSDAQSVTVSFKAPAIGDMRLGLYPNMPANCIVDEPPTRYILDNAYTETGFYKCAGGISGEVVRVDGLSSTLTDVLVRVERADGSTQVALLTPSTPEFVVEATPGALAVAQTYLTIGIEHILLGIDHLLFVLALLILVTGTKTLIWTITAFTVAHSVTLAAATLGLVQVPQAPVEAVIALSIVFVASEIVHVNLGRASFTRQRPWIVAFVFGLLHGFGFAGALNDIGLPEQAIPLALFLFNVGVEIGQLGFVFAALLGFAILSRFVAGWPRWAALAPAYVIGTLAVYWVVERTVGFWA